MGKQARINAARNAANREFDLSRDMLPVRSFNKPEVIDFIALNEYRMFGSQHLFNAVKNNSKLAKVAKGVKVITVDGELIDQAKFVGNDHVDYILGCLNKFFAGVYEENFIDESEKADFDAGIQHGLKGDCPLTGYYRNEDYYNGEVMMVSIAGDSIAVCYYRNQ